MIPTIAQFGPIPLNSFGLMLALCFIAGAFRLRLSFERGGVDPRFAENFVFAGALSGLVGSRLWFVAQHFDELKGDLFGALFASAGLVFYGGFILALVVVFVMCRVYRMPGYALLDHVGPTLAVSYMIGRLGCQLSGDGDYGMATDSIWGMSYATGVFPTPPGVLAFPAPFFESAMAAVILSVTLWAEPRVWWKAPYRRFGLYLILASIARFLIEFVRIEPRFLWGLSQAQWISVGLFTAGLLMVIRPTSKASASA